MAKADHSALIAEYGEAFLAANGRPVELQYLPLTYERGWFVFRYKDAPELVVERHRKAELLEMMDRLRMAAVRRKRA